MKVRYEVTATCANLDVRKRFLDWMKEEHAGDLLKVNGCEECRVLVVADKNVRCEYLFKSEPHLSLYLAEIAPTLRLKVRAHFSEQEITFERSQALLAFEKNRGGQ